MRRIPLLLCRGVWSCIHIIMEFIARITIMLQKDNYWPSTNHSFRSIVSKHLIHGNNFSIRRNIVLIYIRFVITGWQDTFVIVHCTEHFDTFIFLWAIGNKFYIFLKTIYVTEFVLPLANVKTVGNSVRFFLLLHIISAFSATALVLIVD